MTMPGWNRYVNQKRVPPDAIMEATETFIDKYNSIRPKEALCGLSPVEFQGNESKRNMADGCGLSFSVDSWLEEGYKPECYP